MLTLWTLAALVLPLLLYLPGWALLHAARAAAPDPLERHYERVVVSALFSGWLALLLAELGAFSLGLQLAITLALCGGAWLFRRGGTGARGHGGSGIARLRAVARARLASFGGFRAFRDPSAPHAPRPAPQLLTLIAFAAIGLLALILVARPFEVVLGVRDAGVYANTGFAIARTGSIAQSDPLLAALGQAAESDDPALAEPAKQAISNFLISQPRDRYLATRLRAAGFFVNEGEIGAGRVIPQGLHLFPVWIGLLTAVGGPLLGLFAPGLLGFLGAWSVGMLGRRLAGPWVGALAFLFLALNGVQVWFSRYSTAETAAQFLIWAGLYFFAKMGDRGLAPANGEQAAPADSTKEQGRRTRRELTAQAALAEDEGRTAAARVGAGPSSLAPQQSPEAGARPAPGRLQLVAALLAGVAIGQVALARLDFFLLGPAIGYLAYRLVSRRWGRAQTWMALGMGLMLLHAGLHLAFVARAYLFDTGYDRLREYAIIGLFSLPFLTPEVREVYLTASGSGLASPRRVALEFGALAVALGGLALLYLRPALLRRAESLIVARRARLLNAAFVGILLLAAYAYLVRPQIIDADMLFNTRGGWSDPLTRDPAMVALDVREGRLSLEAARIQAGVAMGAGPFWRAEPDPAATEQLRERLRAERGPWQGPFSNQTLNWLRLQGYVGAPISLPVRLWYNEYRDMTWWERLTVDPSTLTSEPAPERPKYLIPLANMVRMGWYLSPLGIVLGVVGYALWLRRGLNSASWLFLVVAFVGTFFFVRQTYGTSDQHYIYILRRFVPIAYPAMSLGIGYALAAIAERATSNRQKAEISGPSINNYLKGSMLYGATAGFSLLLFAFFLVTNRPIYSHVEYAGAVGQIAAAARQFVPGRDVLLLRGGAPIYAESRDVPDLVATPLRFAHGIDAYTVKSGQPGAYAEALAAQVRRWQSEGRTVYLGLSASGGSFALPGFALEPAGGFALDLPEFEQLTDQKPRNVSRLTLPVQLYRLAPSAPGAVAGGAPPIAPADFAAQVGGLYRPEERADGSAYAWSNGEAILRLAWPAGAGPTDLSLELAAGQRPAHLGPAEVCVSAQPEAGLWPTTAGAPVALGCFSVAERPASYAVRLDPALLPPAPTGSLLLRITSEPWVPAAEDARQTDQRAVGVQVGMIR